MLETGQIFSVFQLYFHRKNRIINDVTRRLHVLNSCKEIVYGIHVLHATVGFLTFGSNNVKEILSQQMTAFMMVFICKNISNYLFF